jgi:hypothetical protein
MSEGNENLGKLARKIVTIGKEIGQVTPDGHASGANYDFISYEQVNAILRKKLEEHGLAIIPSFDEMSDEHILLKTKFGEKQVIRTKVIGRALIIDADTGEKIEVGIGGIDQDSGGKSSGQSITEAVKRFELKLFHISTQADVDPDTKTMQYDEYSVAECLKGRMIDPVKAFNAIRGMDGFKDYKEIEEIDQKQRDWLFQNDTTKWLLEVAGA